MPCYPGAGLVKTLLTFVSLLREEGIPICSSQVKDALFALSLLEDWSGKSIYYTLQSTLVKDLYSQKVFARLFPSFFLHSGERETLDTPVQLDQKEEEIFSPLYSVIGGGKNLPGVYVDTFQKLAPSRQKNVANFLQGSLEGRERGRFLLSRVVRGSLEYWRRRFKEEEEEPLLGSSGDYGTHEEGLLHRDMKDLEGEDFQEMSSLVYELARRLSSSIKRKKRTRRLDLRKTIRKNVRYGGLFFHLHYQKTLRKQPGIVLLSDVSGSMARYARFIIQFIYGLSSVVEDIRSFVFAEDLEEISGYFSSSRDFSSTMVQLMEESQEWGGGTDMGQAIGSFKEYYPELISPKNLFLMVSDTRTIRLQEAVSELKSLAKKVKSILWLNTLPREEWEFNPGVSLFSPFCQMQECYQLHHLRKILYQQLL